MKIIFTLNCKLQTSKGGFILLYHPAKDIDGKMFFWSNCIKLFLLRSNHRLKFIGIPLWKVLESTTILFTTLSGLFATLVSIVLKDLLVAICVLASQIFCTITWQNEQVVSNTRRLYCEIFCVLRTRTQIVHATDFLFIYYNLMAQNNTKTR